MDINGLTCWYFFSSISTILCKSENAVGGNWWHYMSLIDIVTSNCLFIYMHNPAHTFTHTFTHPFTHNLTHTLSHLCTHISKHFEMLHTYSCIWKSLVTECKAYELFIYNSTHKKQVSCLQNIDANIYKMTWNFLQCFFFL